MSRVCSTAALLVAFLGTAATARGDVGVCYREGKAALDAGRHDDALRRLKTCLAMAGTSQQMWQVSLAVALAYRALQRRTEAIEYFRWFIDDTGRRGPLSPKWAARRERVGEELRRLEATVLQTRARLTVTSNPPGARVRLDGGAPPLDLTQTTPLTMYVAPGDHRLQWVRDGYKAHVTELTVTVGERRTASADLVVRAAIVAPADNAVTKPGGSSMSGQQLGGWVTLGLGVASGLVAAGVTVAIALDAEEVRQLQAGPVTADKVRRDGALRDRIDRLQPVSWALYGMAGAAVLTGVLLLVLHTDAPQPTTWLAPRPGGMDLGARVRF